MTNDTGTKLTAGEVTQLEDELESTDEKAAIRMRMAKVLFCCDVSTGAGSNAPEIIDACERAASALMAAGFGDVAGAKYAIEMRDTARNERDQALIDWAKAENRARAAALERDAALAAMAAAKAEAWEEGAEAMCDEALPYCDTERNPYRKATS